jgi:hypothetical protein
MVTSIADGVSTSSPIADCAGEIEAARVATVMMSLRAASEHRDGRRWVHGLTEAELLAVGVDGRVHVVDDVATTR